MISRRTFLTATGVIVASLATPWQALADNNPRRRYCYERKRYLRDCACYDQGLTREEQAHNQIGVDYE